MDAKGRGYFSSIALYNSKIQEKVYTLREKLIEFFLHNTNISGHLHKNEFAYFGKMVEPINTLLTLLITWASPYKYI